MGKLKAWGNKFIAFLKKYGIDAILSILIFNFPMYAIAFINDQGFQVFALWWMALWWGLGPLTPGWLVTILLAVFIKWLRSGIWKGILWLKEAIDKLQLQNQLAAYLTAEEINMVLEMAKKVSAESDKKKKAFLDLLRRERMKMIDDQWTKEVNQKEEKNGK